MEKYKMIYIAACVATIPPWGWLLKPLGSTSQAAGLAVQLVGLVVLLYLVYLNHKGVIK